VATWTKPYLGHRNSLLQCLIYNDRRHEKDPEHRG
jgi:hypothetical protein